MNRLEHILAVAAIAAVATLVGAPGAGALTSDELACVGGSGIDAARFSRAIVPKVMDSCQADRDMVCDLTDADLRRDLDGERSILTDAIVDGCGSLEEAFLGFCAGDNVGDIAECVADAYESSAALVGSASVGGGARRGEIQPPAVDRCSVDQGPCFGLRDDGTQALGCCKGFECRIRTVFLPDTSELVTDARCVRSGGYGSPSRAFLVDPPSLLLR